jgi:hypothetical protein
MSFPSGFISKEGFLGQQGMPFSFIGHLHSAERFEREFSGI